MRSLILAILSVFGLTQAPAFAGTVTDAAALTGSASPSDAVTVVVQPDGATVQPEVVTTPPVLHDPVTEPAGAVQDVQGAIRNVSKKGGWGLLAFMLLVMITRLGAAYSARYKALAFLGKGYVHLTLATVGVFALAAYNALLLGGSMYAALAAAIGAVLYKLHTLPLVKPPIATTPAPVAASDTAASV